MNVLLGRLVRLLIEVTLVLGRVTLLAVEGGSIIVGDLIAVLLILKVLHLYRLLLLILLRRLLWLLRADLLFELSNWWPIGLLSLRVASEVRQLEIRFCTHNPFNSWSV